MTKKTNYKNIINFDKQLIYNKNTQCVIILIGELL